MLSQASLFVTPLSLVAPQCAICKDSGEIDSPGSFLDALSCSCQDGQFNLRQFNDLLTRHMTVSMVPADDTRWPDDVHSAYFGEGC